MNLAALVLVSLMGTALAGFRHFGLQNVDTQNGEVKGPYAGPAQVVKANTHDGSAQVFNVDTPRRGQGSGVRTANVNTQNGRADVGQIPRGGSAAHAGEDGAGIGRGSIIHGIRRRDTVNTNTNGHVNAGTDGDNTQANANVKTHAGTPVGEDDANVRVDAGLQVERRRRDTDENVNTGADSQTNTNANAHAETPVGTVDTVINAAVQVRRRRRNTGDRVAQTDGSQVNAGNAGPAHVAQANTQNGEAHVGTVDTPVGHVDAANANAKQGSANVGQAPFAGSFAHTGSDGTRVGRTQVRRRRRGTGDSVAQTDGNQVNAGNAGRAHVVQANTGTGEAHVGTVDTPVGHVDAANANAKQGSANVGQAPFAGSFAHTGTDGTRVGKSQIA